MRWRDAIRRHHREGVAGHTFLFGLSDGRVIDGSRGGNSARWLNHSCAPNCEPIEDGGRIFIHTLRPVQPGEELLFEYLLITEVPPDDQVRAHYVCRCPRLTAGSRCWQTQVENGVGKGVGWAMV